MSQTYRKTNQLETVATKNSFILHITLLFFCILLQLNVANAAEVPIGAVKLAVQDSKPTVVPAYASTPFLSPLGANKKEKQKVTVRFRVRGTGKSYRAEYDELHSEHSWDHPRAFSVRIPQSVVAGLRESGIADVATHFYGRQIDATGSIELLEFGDIERYSLVVKRLQDIKLVPATSSPAATADYLRRDVVGFGVLLSPAFTGRADFMAEVLDEINSQLSAITRLIPPARIRQLQRASIWVELADEADKSVLFHASPDWIAAIDGNVDKIGHIEIVNASNFLQESRGGQPAILLHEFAHVLHQQVLGFEHNAIIDAYDLAQLGQRYDKVKHASGKVGLAYAALDPIEYFAEITEAFFVRNDYYPFDRQQLRSHDPVGYDLVDNLWLRSEAKAPE